MTGRELEARPVADDDLAGRTALVTGCASGIERTGRASKLDDS